MMEMEIEIDEDEAVGLVSQNLNSRHTQPVGSDADKKNLKNRRFAFFFIGIILIGCSVGAGILSLLNRPRGDSIFLRKHQTKEQQTTNGDGYPQFTCPREVKRAENFDDQSFEEVYTNVSQRIMEANISSYLEGFREASFDGWDETYEEVKEGLHDWKVKHFAKYLKDGDSVYESACGIGLNLFLTLEIMQEVMQLKDIKVYGNEYVEESAELANNILDYLLPQANASKGVICQGDSTDLHFVPSNSFDLVYTGYVSTLLNPLNFNGKNINENYGIFYDHLCATKDAHWEAEKLVEIMQERQEDWFGLWVSEMIRIAKPGAPVIIEQVSQPYCTDTEDWGGVPAGFWKAGITKYGWDIDISSITMEDDEVFKTTRYHVFMKKNSQR